MTVVPAARDLACVAAQLGRSPHPFRRVVARCPWHAPAVIENLPYDAGGRPFPTLFWATCPALVAAVAALESGGGVGRFEALLPADVELRRSLAAATRYERRRRRDGCRCARAFRADPRLPCEQHLIAHQHRILSRGAKLRIVDVVERNACDLTEELRHALHVRCGNAACDTTAQTSARGLA